MLNPESIAVIGASSNERKNGGRLFRYITENRFPGKIYPVNPTADEIKGYKAYPSLRDIPDKIDLACIIVESKFVAKVLEDCIAVQVKAAIVYSSGFAKAGEEEKSLQQEIISLCKEGNIRLLGPNSLGILSPDRHVYTAFEHVARKALLRWKPVLVYKTGRSSTGRKAVSSHTGSIAGDDNAYSAAFKKFGVIRLNHIEELIDAAQAFTV